MPGAVSCRRVAYSSCEQMVLLLLVLVLILVLVLVLVLLLVRVVVVVVVVMVSIITLIKLVPKREARLRKKVKGESVSILLVCVWRSRGRFEPRCY